MSDLYYRLECSNRTFYFRKFKKVKETRFFVVIDVDSSLKYIKKNAKSSYAKDTKEKAMESFIARKKIYCKILQGKLTTAKQQLFMAEENNSKILISNDYFYHV